MKKLKRWYKRMDGSLVQGLFLAAVIFPSTIAAWFILFKVQAPGWIQLVIPMGIFVEGTMFGIEVALEDNEEE